MADLVRLGARGPLTGGVLPGSVTVPARLVDRLLDIAHPDAAARARALADHLEAWRDVAEALRTGPWSVWTATVAGPQATNRLLVLDTDAALAIGVADRTSVTWEGIRPGDLWRRLALLLPTDEQVGSSDAAGRD